MSIYREASAAPPDSDASTISTGASDGFTYPPRLRAVDQNCWSILVSPDGSQPQCLGDLLQHLEISGEARSAAQLQALKRARLILRRLSTDASVNTPVTLPARDLLVLTRFALQRLR